MERLKCFEEYLIQQEKSSVTVEKYLRDVRAFLWFTQGQPIDKALVLAYKESIIHAYAPVSVNSMLASVNCFLRFAKLEHCCVKSLKIQKQLFADESRELTRQEYSKLVRAAGNSQLSYILQTICGTGIRISELRFITVESVNKGRACVSSKGKNRIIFLSQPLCQMLKRYMKSNGIKTGSIFVTKNGTPLDRSNIWKAMKALCSRAGVSEKKVYPHNLRHLFAKTFYETEKDLLRLADLLGHSSINTTRIYTVESGDSHMRLLTRVSRLLTT